MTDIEIATLRASTLRKARAQTAEAVERQFIDLEITIKNNSSTSTYDIVTSVRSIAYDLESDTLVLGLEAPAPAGEDGRYHVSRPHIAALGPGATTVIHVSVPRVLRLLGEPRGLSVAVEERDTLNAKHVTCRIEFRDASEPAELALASSAASQHESVEQTVDVRLREIETQTNRG